MSEYDEMTGTQNHLYYEDDLDMSQELESLRSLLQKTQDKFIGQWLGTSYRKLIQENIMKHQANLTRLTGELETVSNNLTKLKMRKENVQKAKCVTEHELEVMKLNLKSIERETDSLLQKKERSEKHVKTITKELAKQKQLLDGKSQSTEECCQELDKNLQFFRTRLGMNFKKISGERLQIVFTSIDDKDRTRPFCFCVKINPDRTYTISDCEPSVPDLDKLVTKLASTNNFRSFVIAMRQCFQSLVS